MNTPSARRALTPRQIKTLNQLLAIGAERPYMPVDLPDRLEAHILAGTADVVSSWTERSLYLTKSQLFTALRCEGQLLADASGSRSSSPHPATVVGIVSHRAIQLSHTHPGWVVIDYVRDALTGARATDANLDLWWNEISTAQQSDIISQAHSRVTSFLDDWPPLEESWSPRFEEPLVAKVGKLTLSCRADLVIGRPRADLRQTLLLTDLKSSGLRENHVDEAHFYALVATLRHRVAPWRSTVYSLAEGDYTDPDIDEERLFGIADKVISATQSIVQTLTETRLPVLNGGDHCRWCPVRDVCSASTVKESNLDVNSPEVRTASL
jgi:hypothetical protein